MILMIIQAVLTAVFLILLMLWFSVRTPHAEYYALCLFGGVCAATSESQEDGE